MADADFSNQGRLWTEYGRRTTDKDHIVCNLCGRECAAHRRSATAFKRHLLARHGLKDVRSLRKGAALRTLRQARESANRTRAAIGARLCPRNETSLGKSEQPSSWSRYVRVMFSGKQKAERSEDAVLGFVATAAAGSGDQVASTSRETSLPTTGYHKSNWESNCKQVHDVECQEERVVGLSLSVPPARAKNNAPPGAVRTCISLNRLADGKAMEKTGVVKPAVEAGRADGKQEPASAQRMSHSNTRNENPQLATGEPADEDCSVCRLVRPESWRTFGQASDDGKFIACKLCSSQFPFPNGSVDVFIRHVAHMHVNHRGAGSAARRRNSEVVRRSVAETSTGLNVEQRSGPYGGACVRASSSLANMLTCFEQRRASYPTEASRVTQEKISKARLPGWHIHLHRGAKNGCSLPKCEAKKEVPSGQAGQAPVTRKSPAASGSGKMDDMDNNLDRKAHKRGRMEDGSVRSADAQGSASKIHRNLISNDVCSTDATSQSANTECPKASGSGDANIVSLLESLLSQYAFMPTSRSPERSGYDKYPVNQEAFVSELPPSLVRQKSMRCCYDLFS